MMECGVSEDFYHDDPIEEIPRSKLRSQLLTTGAVIIGSIFFFQSTFAGNISLSSGTGIEFGQGVSQAVACSGETDLTLTPRSSFTNGSPGAHYLQSVTVSNIPSSCYGVDFTISAYNDSSSTPLALFNSTSTDAVIYNDNGTFSPGIRTTGMTVASSTGTFTATFTAPVAQSSNVFKLTIQSGLHFVYKVGDLGPGGGFVYYVNDTGFDCGATYSATGSPTGGKCKYLEVAPSGWNTGSDPTKVWAVSAYRYADISTIANDSMPGYNTPLGVGLGYKNSLAIVAQNGAYPTNDYAAGAARAYAGGSKSDWYLPSAAELNLLCQWVYGVAPSVTTRCTVGTLNSATYGAGSAGFAAGYHWSSSEQGTSAWLQTFNILIANHGLQDSTGKNDALRVRPIRAF
jgi:hypothetical protein